MVWVTPELFVMRPPTVRVLFEMVKFPAPGAKVMVPVEWLPTVSTEVFLVPAKVMAAPAAGWEPESQFVPMFHSPDRLPVQMAAAGAAPVVKRMSFTLLEKFPARPGMLVVKLPGAFTWVPVPALKIV